jgi:putative membrane protein
MWGYGPGYGMMGWGGDGWGGPVYMIFWLLILIAMVAGVVWLIRSVAHPGSTPLHLAHRSTGLDILEERYARGEIDRDEYLQKKRDMGN